MSKSQNLSRALKNNQNGVILKEPDVRQEAFKDFCQHLSEGYPIKAWSFRKDPYRCHWQTMLSYIKENPGEFDSFLKEEAHAKAYKLWFSKGMKLSDGEVKGNPSPQTWATIMRNMFDWDKEEKPDVFKPSEETKAVIANIKDLNADNPVFSKPSNVVEGSYSED